MAKTRKRLLTFNDPTPLRIDRRLAMEIGFLESVVLLQLEFLISISAHERDGQYWTYQTLQDLKDHHFPWLSVPTISRVLKSLEEMGLILVANYNRSSFDRTRWFALGYQGIRELKSVHIGEDAPISQNEKWSSQIEKSILPTERSNLQPEKWTFHPATSNSHDETTIPEMTTESSPETTTETPTRGARRREGVVVALSPSAGNGTNPANGATETPGCDRKISVVDLLCERGVTRKTAERLAASHPRDAIAFQIEALDYRNAEDPAALLVTAIEQDWAPPESYLKAEKRRQKAARRGQEREAEQRSLQLHAAAQAERDGFLELVWNGLSEAKRSELDQRAKSLFRERNPSLRDKNPDGPIVRAMVRHVRDELLADMAGVAGDRCRTE